MPIYEYTCSICANRFEKRRAMSEMNAPTNCPDCAAPAKRMLSLFAAFSSDGAGQTSAVAGAGGCCGGGGGGGCACAMGA